MIDTDKYKGTNWDLRGQFTHTEMADEVLLLLAEVKRLREDNTYLNHMLNGVDKHTLDHVAEQAQIKMHEAGECYDFCIVCETEGEEE